MKKYSLARNSVVVILALTLASVGAAKSFAAFDDDESETDYALKIARGEARDLTAELVNDPAFAQANSAKIAKLIRSYRADQSPKGPQNPVIQDGPLLGYAASQVLPTLWQGLYDSQWNKSKSEIVDHATLESIFDLFIDAVITDPSSVGDAGEQIGSCLAKKVKAGKDGCTLDTDESHFDEPGFFSLLWAKMNCVLPFEAACSVRQTIFNAAKKQLIATRDVKEADGKTALMHTFENAFPGQFRKGVLDMGADLKQKLPQLLNDKFKGDRENIDQLWATGNTAEVEDAGSSRVTMRGFARGLQTDITAAALLSRSDDPNQRSLAAPLFYAAANRLALLMGGKQARWEADKDHPETGHFVLDKDHLNVDPANPKAVPIFDTLPFGGIGVGLDAQSKPEFSAWDFGAYTASDSKLFRLFPAEFNLDQTGLATSSSAASQTERLEDLAELAIAAEKFLALTHPRGPLGNRFGEISSLEVITSPDSPIVLPSDGRALAVGVLAAVLKNLTDKNLGHAQKTTPGADLGGAGVALYEATTLAGRSTELTRVATVARMLQAAIGLRDTILSNDPQVPTALVAQRGDVDEAIQIMALTLIAKQCQAPDGGFLEFVNRPEEAPRTLLTAVSGIRALTQAYEETHTLAILQSLVQAWQYLDRFWAENTVVPKAVEGSEAGASAREFTPAQLWGLARLWSEVQGSASFADINAKAPGWAQQNIWGKWNTRFQRLRERMIQQLQTPQGPEKVAEAS